MDKQISCPACARDHLALTQEIIDIDVTLKRWSDHGVLASMPKHSSGTAWSGLARFDSISAPHAGSANTIQLPSATTISTPRSVRSNITPRIDGIFSRSIAYVQNENAGVVVDVGCGSGLFLDQLRAAVPLNNAVGIEINKRPQPRHDRADTRWRFWTGRVSRSKWTICQKLMSWFVFRCLSM